MPENLAGITVAAETTWALDRPTADNETLREIVRSGPTRDGRNFHRLMIAQAFENTRVLMAEGFSPAIRPGHTATPGEVRTGRSAAESAFNDQKRIGSIVNLGIKENEDGNVVIDAVIRWTPDGLQSFKSGELPSVSWEPELLGSTKSGSTLAIHIDKVAALGQQQPAIHDLKVAAGSTLNSGELPMSSATLDSVLASYNAKVKDKITAIHVAASASPNAGVEVEPVLALVDEWGEALKQAIVDLDSGDEPVEEPDEEAGSQAAEGDGEPTPEAKMNAATQKQLGNMERRVQNLEFRELVQAGRVAQDQKEDFLDYAKSVGTDKAVALFSKMQVDTPDLGDEIDPTAHRTPSDTDYEASLKRLGMSARPEDN